MAYVQQQIKSYIEIVSKMVSQIEKTIWNNK